MRIIDQTIIILYFFKFINLKFFIMNKKISKCNPVRGFNGWLCGDIYVL